MENPLDALLQRLTGGDDILAEEAARELAALVQPQPVEVITGLDALLQSPEADDRWWALRTLAEIPGQQSLEKLSAGLFDPDAGVRQCAALGLRFHADGCAIPGLIEALSDPDGLVVQLAGDALVAIGGNAVPALLEVLEKGQQLARLEAVRALAMIGDEGAIPALFDALDGDSRWIEYWASLGLERMGVGMSFFLPE
ncbi:MAG TPA: HEAT repeat domain-containing protein [Anaerolineales bacterium]|nr:HEAT repeat domain-containing protein [Anaerolineales bacterium]